MRLQVWAYIIYVATNMVFMCSLVFSWLKFLFSKTKWSDKLEKPWYVCAYVCTLKVGLQLNCECAASVDVDRIAQEMDFQALQANIMNITFCNVDSEVKCVCRFGVCLWFLMQINAMQIVPHVLT